jgi:GT2 family glycosyltransferase
MSLEKDYKSITFIIATNRDEILTLDSIPEGCAVKLEREGNENEARNRGIRSAGTNYVVLCDDDISFTRDFLDKCLASAGEGVIVGLEDYYPLRWLISRFMLFARADWQRIGGFDESVRHGAETDFCIRAEKLGFKIVRLQRSSVFHFVHGKPAYHQAHIRWLWYLWRRHPRQMTLPAFKLAFRKMTGMQL